MAALREREVLRVDEVWRFDPADPPLLAGFYFTELDGRMECVGFSLRSFVVLEEPREDGGGPYDSWCPAIDDPDSDEGLELQGRLYESGEDAAMAAGFGVRGGLGAPRPISATVLRQLPYGHLRSLAIRDWIAREKRHADNWRNRHEDWVANTGVQLTPAVIDLIETVHAEALQRAEAVEAAPRGHSQRKGEDAPGLPRISALYQHFYRTGSTSPTRDVAEALNMSRSTVAKRVMKCREAGLLAPTSRGRAGGLPDEKVAKP